MTFKCWQCNGAKTMLSTGCMYKECTVCRGVGYTKEKHDIFNHGIKDETRIHDKPMTATSDSDIISDYLPDEVSTPRNKIKGRPRKIISEFNPDDNVMAIKSGDVGSIG